jgi:hypothetical protein
MPGASVRLGGAWASKARWLVNVGSCERSYGGNKSELHAIPKGLRGILFRGQLFRSMFFFCAKRWVPESTFSEMKIGLQLAVCGSDATEPIRDSSISWRYGHGSQKLGPGLSVWSNSVGSLMPLCVACC